jgi:hypothetical protein
MSGRFADAVRRRQIAGRRQESNWLLASGPFSLYIRAYRAGSPSSMVSGDRRLSSEYSRQLTTACATWSRDANENDISNVGYRPI